MKLPISVRHSEIAAILISTLVGALEALRKRRANKKVADRLQLLRLRQIAIRATLPRSTSTLSKQEADELLAASQDIYKQVLSLLGRADADPDFLNYLIDQGFDLAMRATGDRSKDSNNPKDLNQEVQK